MSQTISIQNVVDVYATSTFYPPILALYPPHCRDLLEDDVRKLTIQDILERIVTGSPLPKNAIAQYYQYHTKEAAKFVLDKMYQMMFDF